MKVLNLLSTGSVGGIEVLCRELGVNAEYENTFCFLFGEGIVYQQMLEKGLRAISLAGGKRISRERFKALEGVARDQDIIVIHHADPFLQLYFLHLKRRFPKKKFVMTGHSCFEKSIYCDPYPHGKRELRKFLLERTLKKADLQVYVSKAGLESYQKAFSLDMDKTCVVYNGIGMDKVEKGAAVSLKPHAPVRLLYAGRLVQEKGVHLLLEAVASPSLRDRVELTVVGDGAESQALQERAKALGCEKNIHFEGFQPSVDAYLAETDIFVYPSTWEVFGISIVEAMAYGRICIANRVGGIPEIICHEENGFLTESTDVSGVIGALETAIAALSHEDRRQALSRNARETAARLSIRQTARRLKEVYAELL